MVYPVLLNGCVSGRFLSAPLGCIPGNALHDDTWFCRLEEGRYLVAHKAGEPIVTLFKEAEGKGRQGVYDLQQIHSSVPQPPASGLIPWLPVDPAVCLPFHISHSRVPCTFPPKVWLRNQSLNGEEL